MVIRCIRGAGDRPATEAISSPTTPSIQALREIGRQAIDLATDLTAVSQESVYMPDAAVGQLARVYDAIHGAPWAGLCISVQHGMGEDGALSTHTRLLKP